MQVDFFSPSYCAYQMCSSSPDSDIVNKIEAVELFFSHGCAGNVQDFYSPEDDSIDAGPVSLFTVFFLLSMCFTVGVILGFLYQKQVETS